LHDADGAQAAGTGCGRHHEIQQGDCVESLAIEHGQFWQTVWNHPDNRELRRRRENPNVLLPGEVLFLPGIRLKEMSGATELRHRFRRRAVPSHFEVRLLREDQPRAGEHFVLVVDGQLYSGETDADGRLRIPIPPSARKAELRVGQPGDVETYTLCPGYIIGRIQRQMEVIRMRENPSLSRINRRDFVATSSFFLLAARLGGASGMSQQATPRGPDLKEELTPAEMEIVRNSVMAGELGNFFGKGYSCAESGLAVALRYLKKPDDLVWFAGGFGGGLYQQDLCGFLTAGAMAVGLHAGTLPLERKAATQVCVRNVREYWQWWASEAPLHCAEIREGRTDLKVCHRLGRLACARLEEALRIA